MSVFMELCEAMATHANVRVSEAGEPLAMGEVVGLTRLTHDDLAFRVVVAPAWYGQRVEIRWISRLHSYELVD